MTAPHGGANHWLQWFQAWERAAGEQEVPPLRVQTGEMVYECTQTWFTPDRSLWDPEGRSYMVWQAQSVEEQRREFVRIADQGTIPFRALCRRFGISPPTGYKWRERADGADGDWAQDRSRRPRQSPTQTAAETEARVVALRAQYPAWGDASCSGCSRRRASPRCQRRAPLPTSCIGMD